MMFRSLTLISAGLILASSTGCTMMAIEKERQLAASGFQMKQADSAPKEAHLQTLKQRKLFPTKMDGKLVYVYADAKGCNCMYVGSEADYQRYEQMVITERQLNEERDAAEDLDDSSMEWGMWGPWYRPMY
jgi:hypothetical protein